jgi:hypothetical protein
MPESVFGLPTHPLVVHAAVVLVPLAAIALIAVGWNAAWRRRYYLPVMLISLAGAAGSFLAQQTGGPLKRALRDAGKRVGNHPQQGQTAFIFALLLAGVCIALYIHEEYGDWIRARLGIGDRYRLPIDEHIVLYAIAVPVAAVAIATMMLAGHSGATLVWKTAGIVTPTAGP